MLVLEGFTDLIAARSSSTIEFDFSGVRATISLTAENTIQKIGLETISSIFYMTYIISSLAINAITLPII